MSMKFPGVQIGSAIPAKREHLQKFQMYKIRAWFKVIGVFKGGDSVLDE